MCVLFYGRKDDDVSNKWVICVLLMVGVVLGCFPGKRFLYCVQSFQLPKQTELHPLVGVVSPTHSLTPAS